MNYIPKILIAIGILLIIIGIAWPLIQKLGLGRLPGDILFKGKNVKFYFPITTSLIISILISLILTVVFWFFRK